MDTVRGKKTKRKIKFRQKNREGVGGRGETVVRSPVDTDMAASVNRGPGRSADEPEG